MVSTGLLDRGSTGVEATEAMKALELIAVTKRFGEVRAVDDVSFEVQQGQIISVLGPSGCGKTTTLRLIAGFETPDKGTVMIAGADMGDKRPYERNVGLLFQDYALFPHMTVEQNVSYGLRRRNVSRGEIPRRTDEVLSLVKLRGLEKRRPSALSGGQQQRVALARALATQPAVILLDEPLSALDAKLRQELRVELKEILNSVGTTTIVVTHDQEEAMSLADHVIVMNHGRIEQQGSPTDIYSHPVNKFVAEFIGRSNWFSGRIVERLQDGMAVFATDDGQRLRVLLPVGIENRSIELGVRPERLRVLSSHMPNSGLERNLILGNVEHVVHLGSDVHLVVRLSSGQRVVAVEKHLGQSMVQVGSTVTVSFAAEDCIVVPAQSG